jgi:hypothetical protein
MTGPDLKRDADTRWWPLRRDPLFLESSRPGVFVAGDLRHGSVKRVASAVGEGAMAIALSHTYLKHPRRLAKRAHPGELQLASDPLGPSLPAPARDCFPCFEVATRCSDAPALPAL